MPTVTSKDGTSIAYERSGDGPAVILVDGALCYRDFGPMRPLAALLAQRLRTQSARQFASVLSQHDRLMRAEATGEDKIGPGGQLCRRARRPRVDRGELPVGRDRRALVERAGPRAGQANPHAADQQHGGGAAHHRYLAHDHFSLHACPQGV